MADNIVAGKENENRRIKKVRTIVALCVCVIVAFGMWVYVMTVESPEHEHIFSDVTVELTGTDELSENDLAIFSGYGVKLDVTLSGKKSVVSSLEDGAVVVTADVGSLTASGRYNLKVTVDVPAGCKLVSISQDTVSVYVDKSAQTAVDLTEKRENTNLPDGCFTGPIDLSVDMVTVNGPLTILSRIDKALVTIDMSTVTKTTSVTERIILVDRNGEKIDSPYIDFYPREITVEIPILKTVRVPVEVEFKNGFLDSDSAWTETDPEFVEVTGDVDAVNRGDCVMPVIVDEKTSLEGGEFSGIVALEVADGLEISSQKVKLSVGLKGGYAVKEYTVAEDKIFGVGAKDGVNYTWRSTPVTVELLGPSDILEQITDDQLALVFDMSPYSSTNAGTIRIKADVDADSEYADDVMAVGAYYINVTIDKNND